MILTNDYFFRFGLALTYWYEIYYDVWLGGQYFRKIAEMHKQYGCFDLALHLCNLTDGYCISRPDCSDQSSRSPFQRSRLY